MSPSLTPSPTAFTCPNCNAIIELTQAMSAQLSAQIKRQYEAEYAPLREQLRIQRASIDEREKSLEQSIRDRLDQERDALTTKARETAERDFNVELTDRKAQLDEVKKRLDESEQSILSFRKRERDFEAEQKRLEAEREDMESRVREEAQKAFDVREKGLREAAQKAFDEKLAQTLTARDAEAEALRAKVKEAGERELELLKAKRDIEEREERLKLEVQRQLDAERKTIRDKTLQEADEEHGLKLKEKDVQMESLRRQIDELRRKADQGSQQLQGEVQELALEELLAQLFPDDQIDEVPKGIKGADAVQRVGDGRGGECGTILWESKRTGVKWQDGWLTKLRDDQRAAGAHVAVLVSAVMPKDVPHLAQVDGVWVCSWALASGTAALLRNGLIGAARSARALEGRHTKIEAVYQYLTSPEFFNRVSGIVESFQTMQDELAAEKRAYHKHWNKREKQIERAMINTTGMYGDLQGIIGGSTLREIEGMGMPMLGADPN